MITARQGLAACVCSWVAAGTACLGAAALALSMAADVRPPQDFAQQASWQIPSAAEVRALALAWLAEQKCDAAVRQQAEALWPETAPKPAAENKTPAAEPPQLAADPAPSADGLLARVAATFSLADPQTKTLVELCRRPRDQVVLADFPWLADDKTPAWERANLRLLYGRWLAHERLYDEALTQLEGLRPDDVVDPSALLFYQGVVYYHSLKKEPGAVALQRLLEQAERLPRRYVSVARLMLSDLKDLDDDSLDHIARRMQDIQRRLDLGRAGRKVRDVEDGVIASLDKLIEEIEKQQAAAAAAAAGQGTIRSTSPAPDSKILGGKGPGQVDRKPLGNKAGWGDLPPKQRQETLQQIGKDYPAHYRDLIEQYFRKLASEDEATER